MRLAWLAQRFPGLGVLRHAHYARAVASRFCASLAWQMFTVAVGWQVYALTRDPLALGLVGLSEFLPFVTLVLFGGHVADQVDRRTVLLVAWSWTRCASGRCSPSRSGPAGGLARVPRR